jgi:hypothetical protein
MIQMPGIFKPPTAEYVTEFQQEIKRKKFNDLESENYAVNKDSARVETSEIVTLPNMVEKIAE